MIQKDTFELMLILPIRRSITLKRCRARARAALDGGGR